MQIKTKIATLFVYFIENYNIIRYNQIKLEGEVENETIKNSS